MALNKKLEYISSDKYNGNHIFSLDSMYTLAQVAVVVVMKRSSLDVGGEVNSYTHHHS